MLRGLSILLAEQRHMNATLTQTQNGQQHLVLEVPQMLTETDPSHYYPVLELVIHLGRLAVKNVLANTHPSGKAAKSKAATTM